jgi:hypothetical protein
MQIATLGYPNCESSRNREKMADRAIQESGAAIAEGPERETETREPADSDRDLVDHASLHALIAT